MIALILFYTFAPRFFDIAFHSLIFFQFRRYYARSKIILLFGLRAIGR